MDMKNSRYSGMALLRTFAARHESELAKGALEARGLRVILASDDCGSMDPALGLATGGAKVYVEESCIEEARGILEGEFDGE
jgi:hypothetical protein